MGIRDLVQKTKLVLSVSPQVLTDGTVNGAGVDTTDFDSAVVHVASGTVTDGTHTPSLEDSPDNSAFTAVVAAELVGSFTAIAAANDDEVQEVGYIGLKKFLRVVMVTTGATTGALIAATIVLGDPRDIPAGQAS